RDPDAFTGEEDVRGFEVAMHDVAFVRGRHSVRDGNHDLDRFGLAYRATRPEILLEVFAVEQLLDDEWRTVVVARDVEHVDDVRMTHSGDGARFAKKPEHVVLVRRVLLVEDFHRDVATERHVGCAVDLAHTADAQTVTEQVFPTDEIALTLTL